MDDYDVTDFSEPEPPRRGRRLWWISVVLLVFFSLALLAVGSCVFLFFRGQSGAGDAIENFLRRISAGEHEQAYHEALAEEWRDTQSLRAFAELHDRLLGKLGKFRHGSITQSYFRMGTGGKQGKVSFSAQFDEGPCTIRFLLMWRAGDWKIMSANYNSDLITSLYRCSQCGHAASDLPRFCSQCGAEMGSGC